MAYRFSETSVDVHVVRDENSKDKLEVEIWKSHYLQDKKENRQNMDTLAKN